MIYLNQTDLTTDTFDRFIQESTSDAPGIIDKNELRSIEIVKSFLSGRYNVNMIFNPVAPIRNELLIDIISKITLYKIFRRNAARKLPQDVNEDYTWALKELEKINTRRISLNDLPPAESSPGQTISNTVWGNNSNRDFYI
jgi:hypothetical protein